MITHAQGDMLESDAEALVNTVNCVGVMGRGIALQFRKAFPANYKAYKAACEANEMQPGKMFVVELGALASPKYIINFPTKRHWKGKSRIEDIAAGLDDLVQVIRERGIRSIAVPPLGCGLGGLDWQKVRPIIESKLTALSDVQVQLYAPDGAPSAGEMVRSVERPRMTVGRATLLELMRRYLSAVMDPSVSLLEIHKLMYFMQESGESLRLTYARGPYGPYAENLRHVLTHIEGHFIQGYGDAADVPDKKIDCVPEALAKAEAFLARHPDTRARVERVADLIEGFETPYGMELLSTIHWVATREDAKGPDEAIRATYSWNDRKKMFKEAHIRTAWEVLHERDWLTDQVLPGTPV
jgi:O-acetyl-ADP-ribose deacetylase (regulator of RNase III)